MNRKTELTEFLELAEKMGIEVETNSETPGFFVTKGDREVQINPLELFPELDENLLIHGEITLDGIDIIDHIDNNDKKNDFSIDVKITSYNKYNFSGAA